MMAVMVSSAETSTPYYPGFLERFVTYTAEGIGQTPRIPGGGIYTQYYCPSRFERMKLEAEINSRLISLNGQ
jgi:hypothetical protein